MTDRVHGLRLLLLSWRRPVYRDGAALVSSSALTSLVGLLYWVLAARLLPPAQVGLGSALVSTLMLLGSVGQLNLEAALLRFVPVAGAAARSLVAACYATAATAAAAAGVGFAVAARWWAPELVTPLGPAGLVVLLGVGAPLWSLFAMQDHVLTAVGRAVLVPVANLVFAVVKVGLLVAAAELAVPGAVAVSWAVSTALVVGAVTLWMVRGLATDDPGTTAPITAGTVARFATADFAGELCWTAVVFGLPVVVLARLGAEAAAAFGVAWTITSALYLVAHGMGQALVAHLAPDPSDLPAACRGMAARAYLLLVPAVAVLAVLRRPLLAVFGAHYAAAGTSVLALAALSALPDVVVRARLAAARVQQRRALLVGLPALVTVLIITGAWVLAPRLGLVGVGLAVLGAQTVTAGVVLAAALRPGRPAGSAAGPTRTEVARPPATRAAGAPGSWS